MKSVIFAAVLAVVFADEAADAQKKRDGAAVADAMKKCDKAVAYSKNRCDPVKKCILNMMGDSDECKRKVAKDKWAVKNEEACNDPAEKEAIICGKEAAKSKGAKSGAANLVIGATALAFAAALF